MACFRATVDTADMSRKTPDAARLGGTTGSSTMATPVLPGEGIRRFAGGFPQRDFTPARPAEGETNFWDRIDPTHAPSSVRAGRLRSPSDFRGTRLRPGPGPLSQQLRVL